METQTNPTVPWAAGTQGSCVCGAGQSQQEGSTEPPAEAAEMGQVGLAQHPLWLRGLPRAVPGCVAGVD